MSYNNRHNGETSHYPFRHRRFFSPAQRLLQRLYPESPDFKVADKNILEIDADWVPDIDLLDTDESIIIRADLPGVETENISIRINNNVLWLTGERRDSESENNTRYFCCERQYGTFARQVIIPETVDIEKAHAEFKNGLLKITLQKKHSAKPRDIEIKLG